jgi:hypothetical protein
MPSLSTASTGKLPWRGTDEGARGWGSRSLAGLEALPPPPAAQFGAVVLLHVMDRCDAPAELLRAAAQR